MTCRTNIELQYFLAFEVLKTSDDVEALKNVINSYSNHIDCLREEKFDRTLLAQACFFGRTACVTMLLEEFNADITVVDNSQRKLSPLHLAVLNDHSKTVQVLIQHGADLQQTDSWSKTALELALQEDKKRCIVFLMNYVHGPNLSKVSTDSSLSLLRTNVDHENKLYVKRKETQLMFMFEVYEYKDITLMNPMFNTSMVESIPLNISEIIETDEGKIPTKQEKLVQFELTISNQNETFVIPLKQEESITIGRSRSNRIPLGDLAVSKHHACIVYSEGSGYCIYDYGSTHGTYLNETRISLSKIPSEFHSIRPGDIISVGNVCNFDFIGSSDFINIITRLNHFIFAFKYD